MLGRMFTGIVAAVGMLVSAAPAPAGGRRLGIALGGLSDPADPIRLGESIAVLGACLTVARLDVGRVEVDLSAETCKRTTLGRLRIGAPLNLERALALGDRLGGHLVSGHIDGIGQVVSRRAEGRSARLTIRLPRDGSVKVIEKGALAVDGVSLTTFACTGGTVSFALIPHTLAATTLGTLKPRDPVNLEQDQIGRWVELLLGAPRRRPRP